MEEHKQVIRFSRTSDAYGCFSKYSGHQVMVDGCYWKTTEHYFQAQKFKDYEHQLVIMQAETPLQAAKLGRDRTWPLRKDWENIKDEVMRKAVKAKVMQHASVREKLLSTENAILIEHNEHDSYWADGGDSSGKNMLGKILMEIRAELTKDGSYDELKELLLPPWEMYPQLNRRSIGWRMGYGESYLLKWGPWYDGLSDKGKLIYQQNYPAQGEWEGYYNG